MGDNEARISRAVHRMEQILWKLTPAYRDNILYTYKLW